MVFGGFYVVFHGVDQKLDFWKHIGRFGIGEIQKPKLFQQMSRANVVNGIRGETNHHHSCNGK